MCLGHGHRSNRSLRRLNGNRHGRSGAGCGFGGNVFYVSCLSYLAHVPSGSALVVVLFVLTDTAEGVVVSFRLGVLAAQEA